MSPGQLIQDYIGPCGIESTFWCYELSHDQLCLIPYKGNLPGIECPWFTLLVTQLSVPAPTLFHQMY